MSASVTTDPEHGQNIQHGNTVQATKQVVPVESMGAYQMWMTNRILDMMEETRILKHNKC